MHKVWFHDSEKNRVRAILSGRGESIAVLCHGFTSSKDSGTYTALQEALDRRGIATLRFDFFGHGESEGRLEDITVSKAVDDILSALNFVRGRKVALMGSSFGGLAAMIAASRTDRLACLALKSPVSNYEVREIMRRGRGALEKWKHDGFAFYTNSKGKFRINYSFFADFRKNNAWEIAGKISVPTLIVHGDCDESVPLEQSRKTAGLIRDCSLREIRGADHNYTDPKHRAMMIKMITGFIAGHLN